MQEYLHFGWHSNFCRMDTGNRVCNVYSARINLVSVYKHNAELLKEAGEKVNAGEAIAIVGNSGENYRATPPF